MKMIFILFHKNKPILETTSETLIDCQRKTFDYVVYTRSFPWATAFDYVVYKNGTHLYNALSYPFIRERRERGYVIKNVYSFRTKLVKELDNGKLAC